QRRDKDKRTFALMQLLERLFVRRHNLDGEVVGSDRGIGFACARPTSRSCYLLPGTHRTLKAMMRVVMRLLAALKRRLSVLCAVERLFHPLVGVLLKCGALTSHPLFQAFALALIQRAGVYADKAIGTPFERFA